MVLCLFIWLLVVSIVGVTIICNMKGTCCYFLCFMFHNFPLILMLNRFLCQLFYNFCYLSSGLIFNYVVHECFVDVWLASYLKDLCIIHIIFNYLSSQKVGFYRRRQFRPVEAFFDSFEFGEFLLPIILAIFESVTLHWESIWSNLSWTVSP